VTGPARWLQTHRAPAGLLEASREPEPRSFGVRVGPAIALAAAVGLVVGIAGGRALEDTPPPPAGTRPVTLVYHDPGAERVDVAGSFNDWDATRTPLHPVGDGAFRTVLWLPPGQYEYQFVVDGGTWRPDPLAVRQREDGFGAVNSVVDLF